MKKRGGFKEGFYFYVPIVMIMEDKDFIISCDTLGIYSQAKSPKKAKKDFETCINLLLDKWEDQGKLVSKLRALNLLDQSVPEEARIKKVPLPILELGSYTQLEGCLA